MHKSYSLILAKIESTYGVDSVPTGAQNAVLTGPVDIEPTFRKVERLNVKQFLGNRPSLNLGESVKVSFETEVKGSGVAGTPPEIGVLFRGASMSETVVPATSVTYEPQDAIDGPSITVYAYQHDHLWKILGCRGTWSLEGKAGENAKIKWEFTGLFAGPVDSAIITNAVFQNTIPAQIKSAGFALGAYAGVIENFKVTYGNELAKRPSVNAPTGFLAQFVKERKVAISIDPEAEALSAFNPLDMIENGTESALTFTIGAVAGNIVGIACPRVVVDTAKYADREDILTWDGGLVACPVTGEDDISVAFT